MAEEAWLQDAGTCAPPNKNGGLPAVSGEWLAIQLALSGLLVATLLRRTGMAVPENGALALVLTLTAALAAARYAIRAPTTLAQRQLCDLTEYVLLFFGTALLGVIASYPAAALTSGFDDGALERVDRLLHFDWLALYLAVSHHPWLQVTGSAAYAAIYVSPLILLGHFAWAQRRAQAREFLVTFWVAGLLTLALFPLIPAEGPLAFLWHGPIPYMPTNALYEGELIPALRTHRMTAIDIGALRGLVSAPSFHTVSAVLYCAAAWPIPRLRRIVVPINAAMLLAIPIEGTHYLADMVAGSLVAAAAIVMVKLTLALIRRRRSAQGLEA